MAKIEELNSKTFKPKGIVMSELDIDRLKEEIATRKESLRDKKTVRK